jgi:2-polyprenyl-3-methyl-5-hydroxy-6-metoxy-1,4-benzoquinol methylase
MEIFSIRTECPACDAKDFRTVFSVDLLDPNVQHYVARKIRDQDVLEQFHDTQYALLKCDECGLIFQKNILSDHYLSTLYDEWVVHREEKPQSNKYFAYYSNELCTIATLFDKPISAIRVLDYGLGAGRWAKVAAAMGFDVVGTDLSHQVLTTARGHGLRVLPINEIEQHEFDFINTEQVFEHLARPKETLSQLTRCLAPGGIIKISVPDGKNIEKRLPLMDWSAPRDSKRYLVPVTPLMHINTFSDTAIESMGRLFRLTPVRPSLRNEYQILDATTLKSLAKSILRPLYRRWRGTTYVFLRAST